VTKISLPSLTPPAGDDPISILTGLAAECRKVALATTDPDHRNRLLTLAARLEAKVERLTKDAEDGQTNEDAP
jgi:hypothetical protein